MTWVSLIAVFCAGVIVGLITGAATHRCLACEHRKRVADEMDRSQNECHKFARDNLSSRIEDKDWKAW